jgi:hypothetical protein
MRRLLWLVLPLLCHEVLYGATPPLVCPAGGPVGSVDLRVSSRRGSEALPLRTINNLEEGDTILYRPIFNPGEVRHGEVTMVLVPVNKTPKGEKLLVLDSKPAAKAEQWKVPWRVSTVAFVYGPAGLNVKKVGSFLSKDDELVGQLADYAAKTAETEALIAALASANSTDAMVQSTMQGFASAYGLNVQFDRNAATDQQALTLFRTLNPAVASYDPIAPDVNRQFGQTAGLATSVASLFFGNPVGLAAGGTAMLMNLRALAFPSSQFRSSFSQPLPNDGLGLCGKRDAPPPHTRVVYLWAARVPNAGPPQISIGKANSLPRTVTSPLPVSGPDGDLKLLDRARNWQLQPEKGKPIPIKVETLAATKTLQLNLGPNVAAGSYTLGANWDWEHFQVAGKIEAQNLSDFKTARLIPASQDLLVANAGKIPVTMDGSDFEFVTKVQIQKANDEFASPAPVAFVLPVGLRDGPQSRIDLQIDTSGAEAGAYKLVVSQVDGTAHPVPLEILPAPPTIENLPLVVNQGSPILDLRLKGSRLQLLTKIEIAKAKTALDSSPGETVGRRLRLQISPDLQAGTVLAMKAYVNGRSEPLVFADAVRIVGVRPQIAEAKVSLPSDLDVKLEDGELPGSAFISAMMSVRQLQSNSVVKLSCEGESEPAPFSLALGQQSGASSFQQLTPTQVFLSIDTGHWLNGCKLQAIISNGVEGDSPPYLLGKIVRIPKIESLELPVETDPTQQQVPVTLIGQGLETIQKLGWNDNDGQPVTHLPLAMSGAGPKQTLEVPMTSPPTSDAPLYVWLWGESKSRITTIHPTLVN